MRKTPLSSIFALCLLLACLPSLEALDYLDIHGGLLYLGNSEPESAPSPLLPVLGASIPVKPRFLEGSHFALEAGLLLFGTTYQYQNRRATPAELEHRDFWVQGVLLDARIGLDWQLIPDLRLGLKAGPALLLRVPVPLFADAGEDFGPTLGYLYGTLRFFYPEAELFAGYRILKDFELKLSLRACFPLFHLWDGEGLPFYDQLMIAGLLGVVYTLP